MDCLLSLGILVLSPLPLLLSSLPLSLLPAIISNEDGSSLSDEEGDFLRLDLMWCFVPCCCRPCVKSLLLLTALPLSLPLSALPLSLLLSAGPLSLLPAIPAIISDEDGSSLSDEEGDFLRLRCLVDLM